ncbi:class I SAM-dependent methyltransferase [Streptomyces sp. NPDC053474]|uniref:class I SAM-dependent methyltransferase n=1 Tax=Streptomyces sp. NPDC053474 TaxID=3365704 RepID=UPI0037CE295E
MTESAASAPPASRSARTVERPVTDAERKAALAGLFDRSAPTYERVGVNHFADLGQRLVALADVLPGDRLLDIGCGTGAVLVPAARATGTTGSAVGVDLSPGMVARSRAALREAGLRHAHAVVADAETIDWSPQEGVAPPANGSVDVVFAGISLFFLPHPRQAVARYRELLGPGGRLALSWWGRPDPRWDPVFAASAPYGRGGSSHALPEDSPFRSVEALHAMLEETGYATAETVEQSCVTRFRGPHQWWDWVWSTAGRMFWEGVPAESRERAEAAVNAELERLRAPDGSLTTTSAVRFTVARAQRAPGAGAMR